MNILIGERGRQGGCPPPDSRACCRARLFYSVIAKKILLAYTNIRSSRFAGRKEKM